MQTKPALDEIEISIFGKGYGECLVIHLENNEWIIVDSFKNSQKNIPIALEYLRSIDVDVKTAVKAIVATHWHDDHIRGLSDLVTKCENASFICSKAIEEKDFLTFIYSDMDLGEGRQGKTEIVKTIDELKKSNRMPPKWALEDRCLLNNLNYKVFSLSPSDQSVFLTMQEISRLLPKPMQPRRSIPYIRPNMTSVVLKILIADKSILLGADQEEINDSLVGWSRILISQRQESQTSFVFKVPHHGSVTSHHDDVWKNLLDERPVASLTSFVRGDNVLPKKSDIRRILSYTSDAWITTNPFQKKKTVKRDNMVERTIKQSVKSIYSIADVGHIRIRLKHNESTQRKRVELFGSAMRLKECL